MKLQFDPVFNGCPLEAQAAIESADRSIHAALACLDITPDEVPSRSSPATGRKLSPDAPTRPQGQFLAYIWQYVKSNHAGVAPTHAALQKFLTSVRPR